MSDFLLFTVCSSRIDVKSTDVDAKVDNNEKHMFYAKNTCIKMRRQGSIRVLIEKREKKSETTFLEGFADPKPPLPQRICGTKIHHLQEFHDGQSKECLQRRWWKTHNMISASPPHIITLVSITTLTMLGVASGEASRTLKSTLTLVDCIARPLLPGHANLRSGDVIC
jgi:hypothetical protein